MRRDGQLLVVRQRTKSWSCLSGGHVEPGEQVESALIRELREELGIHAKIVDLPVRSGTVTSKTALPPPREQPHLRGGHHRPGTNCSSTLRPQNEPGCCVIIAGCWGCDDESACPVGNWACSGPKFTAREGTFGCRLQGPGACCRR
ncbi:NUDIX hydrolase [Parasphingorhabdus pacifica]